MQCIVYIRSMVKVGCALPLFAGMTQQQSDACLKGGPHRTLSKEVLCLARNKFALFLPLLFCKHCTNAAEQPSLHNRQLHHRAWGVTGQL